MRPSGEEGTMLWLRSIGLTVVLFVSTFGTVAEASAAPVNIFGLEHTALGGATLQVVSGTAGDQLVVSNIGPSGADGVSVALPSNTTLWEAHINDLGNLGSYEPGSFLQITSIGTIDGVPNQIAATGRATNLGSQVGINFDLSTVSSAPLKAEYFFNGSLIATEIVPNNPSVEWLAARWPFDGDLTVCPFIPRCVDVSITWKGFGSGVSLTTPDDETFIVDTIELTTTTLDATSVALSGATLTAAGIPRFTINSEDLVTQTPEPTSLVLLLFGLVGLACVRNYRPTQIQAIGASLLRLLALHRPGLRFLKG
jgi:hypothetical protein